MRIKSLASRHVRLSLSDFDADPAELGATLAAPDVLMRRKGDASSITGRATLRSSIAVCHGFQGGIPWDEALQGLITSLSGTEGLRRLLARAAASDQHIHFQLPVKGSPFQENNYLGDEMLELLRDLRLWVGLDFSEFDPGDPTHLDPRS